MNETKASCPPLLNLTKYRIHCRAKDKITLPPYKGAAFHGGFGYALKALSPYYFKLLCDSDGQQKPCVLLPPLDKSTAYPAGHEFFFEITLVGRTGEYFPLCRDAVEYLGGRLGFGEGKGKFDVFRVDTVSPFPEHSGDIIQHQGYLHEKSATCTQLTLHFDTNMRLKERDTLVRTSPAFIIFFSRLLGRLNSLSLFYGDGPLCSRHEKAELLDKAVQIEIADDDTRWEDWSRFSGRQKQWMLFGGLTGRLTYSGSLTPFLPYLSLGEWAHVGGKTSFGLGKYTMEVMQ